MDATEIARRFDLGVVDRLSDGPVARGRQGVVWRLDTSDGRWAVKVPLRRTSEEEVRTGTALQEAAHAAGVPTPLVRRTVDGTVFPTVGDVQLRVYEWVDLLAPDPGLDPAVVGTVLAMIHQAAPDTVTGPVDPWYHAPVGAERWDALVARLRSAGAPFTGRLAALRDELVALESWLEPPAALRTCHRDLWADNLLPTAAGGVCVIDWDNSGPADPGHELGCVLFEFARTDAGRARALADAYQATGGPGGVRRPGDFSMLIAQLGHIAEIAANDWLEPNPRCPQRSDAEGWIAEILDEPHTRELLHHLLAAANGAATERDTPA